MHNFGDVFLEHRERKINPRGEVTVEHALAYAGLLRDGVEWYVEAAFCKEVARGHQKGIPVSSSGRGPTV